VKVAELIAQEIKPDLLCWPLIYRPILRMVRLIVYLKKYVLWICAENHGYAHPKHRLLLMQLFTCAWTSVAIRRLYTEANTFLDFNKHTPSLVARYFSLSDSYKCDGRFSRKIYADFPVSIPDNLPCTWYVQCSFL